MQLKEEEMGPNDSSFLSYMTEIIKLFNQVGMQLMNQGRLKPSADIFRTLVRFLSAQDLKRDGV
jgi:hypothetical protein